MRKDGAADIVRARDILHRLPQAGERVVPAAVPGVHDDHGCLVAVDLDVGALPAAVALAWHIQAVVGGELLVVIGR